LGAQNGEVADAEYDVADQAEHSGSSDLAEVDTGDSDQREDSHEDLHRFADGVFGRRGERGVQVRVLDLDRDEQQSSDDGGQAGRPGELVPVMVISTPRCLRVRGGRRGMTRT
jgi:hypothetical protein